MRIRIALGAVACAIAMGAVAVAWGWSGTAAQAAPVDEPKKADDKAPSFKNDVQPILNASCVNCHNGKRARGRVDLETYAAVMKSVQAGTPEKSRLVKSLMGAGAKQMPPKKTLPSSDIDVIKAWIAAGAKND